MNQTNEQRQHPDLREYLENRPKFPLEELAKYGGMHVAFSLDGKRIVASGASWDELFDNMEAAGIDENQVVGSYIGAPGEVYL